MIPAVKNETRKLRNYRKLKNKEAVKLVNKNVIFKTVHFKWP